MSKKRDLPAREFRPVSKYLPEDSAPRSPTVRQPGHYVDAKLNRILEEGRPSDGSGGLTTSEIWTHKNLTDMEPAIERLVFALVSLLEQKTNGYQAQDGPPLRWGDKKLPQAQLVCTPSELYREYTGTSNYSGKDIENIKKLVRELVETKFRVVYTSRCIDEKSQKELVNRIDVIVPILTEYAEVRKGLTPEESEKLDQDDRQILGDNKVGLLKFTFCPMMTHDITRKWVEIPRDYYHKLDAIVGHGNKKSKAMMRLGDYLLRELSNKRTTSEINKDNLIETLGLQKDWRDGRKKRVQDRINEAMIAHKGTGLILDYEVVTGKQGQEKYVFRLNREFTRTASDRTLQLPPGGAS